MRDKLLGRQSLDIDIALDDMLGREFAERVNVHLAEQVGTSWWWWLVPLCQMCLIRMLAGIELLSAL